MQRCSCRRVPASRLGRPDGRNNCRAQPLVSLAQPWSASKAMPGVRKASASAAFTFVLTMGIVNLFADMTYEGGGSINGPFLGTLGASAATVSIIAGVGEFLGYAIRLPAGYISDKTGNVWLLTFIGYIS